MKNILIACDKFKGSLTALEVCQAIEIGLIEKEMSITTQLLPLADGGDGTLAVLDSILNLNSVLVNTVDPLGRKISARYLSDMDKEPNQWTAFIELAEASGITRLAVEEFDILNTTTLGTGLLIKDAIAYQHPEITLCLGGSCTNDMGLGILYALGYSFLDKTGQSIIPSGGVLNEIRTIIAPSAAIDAQINILCDVKNPLYGRKGAAQVYGPEKGARVEDIRYLDKGMRHMSQLIYEMTGKNVSELEGAGAAGGVAAGLYGLLEDVKLMKGFDYISNKLELEKAIIEADVVITGEGQLDKSSLEGKVVSEVAKLCYKHHKKVIAVVGRNILSQNEMAEHNLSHCLAIMDYTKSMSDAQERAVYYLSEIGKTMDLG